MKFALKKKCCLNIHIYIYIYIYIYTSLSPKSNDKNPFILHKKY